MKDVRVFKTHGIAAATMTGATGVAVGTWIGTALPYVQMIGVVVATIVAVFSGLYYFEQWRKLRNERKRCILPR